MTEELLLECKKYIESGGIPFGSSFEKVSVRQFKMMDIDADAAELYLNQHRENLFVEQLFSFI